MKKNLTLHIDEQLIKQMRYIALDHDMSLSSLVESIFEKMLLTESLHYETAKKNALKFLNKGFHLGGEKFNRESLYEERLSSHD